MNTGRLIGAGLLAGLVLNMGEAALHGAVYGDATAAAMKSLGRDVAGSGSDTAQLVAITFVQGLLGMLLYAAVQPRWKPGLGTAGCIGLILWALSGVYSGVYLSAGLAGLLPMDVTWGPVAWEFILYPIALVVGSLVYKAS